MDTYLITGGAGFIGSHLAESLLGDGHAVIVIDDLSTGSVDNLRAFCAHPRFELVHDSVLNERRMGELVGRADFIFHLAAVVGVARVLESPIRTIQNIVHGTDVVLRLTSEQNKVVFVASTSEVYGKSNQLPFSEGGDMQLGATSKGRWSYACAKAIDEFLALAYFRERQLAVVVARHFNTVGPRQSARYGMVLPRFIEQALSGQPLTVHGDGSQQRCFCYVGDVVWTIKRLVLEPSNYGKVFNVGSAEEVSILQLAQRVKAKIGSASEISFVPYHLAYDNNFEDMPRRIPDLQRLHAALGFRRLMRLDEIIERMAEHYLARA
ncbi:MULTISPECIES: GDP-mannose 4,6-dehydratase [unclassified Janthinobacterium]|uniref:GDP-mannose 4,6-dehydratase n=1 Tax=unclassified Janthinobacterium TaxID=2610881 RepID=UPI000345D825|nr:MULTISPECIES: GDP-mannose 4,6-dehydratase [unclassified Janthinobacterium]MEC5163182.1 UDP-glucose 4-epimerase [Janthinobacterium sp. CG_S6]